MLKIKSKTEKELQIEELENRIDKLYNELENGQELECDEWHTKVNELNNLRLKLYRYLNPIDFKKANVLEYKTTS